MATQFVGLHANPSLSIFRSFHRSGNPLFTLAAPKGCDLLDSYVTLLPGQFRLFELQTSISGQPQGRLQTFDLERPPSFRALSYVCGQPFREFRLVGDTYVLSPDDECQQEANIPLVCGSQSTLIIPNLFDALQHLIDKNMTGWIWVDALCIRQDDPDERAAQIQQMRNIYNCADEVIIWLGAGEADYQARFLTDLNELGSIALNPGPESLDPVLKTRGFVDDELCKEYLGCVNLQQKLTEFLTFLIRCRVFHRTWTMQEFVLGKRLRHVWGILEVDWDLICEILRFMGNVGWYNGMNSELSITHVFPPQAYRQIFAMKSFRSKDTWTATADASVGKSEGIKNGNLVRWRAFIFAEICSLMRYTSCSDPRDRVFAVLGIADYLTGAKSTDIVTVDYRKTFEEVYIGFASSVLQDSQSLDLLAQAVNTSFDDASKLADLPSWVDDYRSERVFSPIYESQLSMGIPLYSPAAGLDYSGVTLNISDRFLHCSGLQLDTVRDSKQIDFLHTGFADHSSCLNLEDVNQIQSAAYEPLDVLWRSFLLGLFEHKKYPPPPGWLDATRRGFLAVIVESAVCTARLQGFDDDGWKARSEFLLAKVLQMTSDVMLVLDFATALRKHWIFYDDPTTTESGAVIGEKFTRDYNFEWAIGRGASSRPVFMTETGLFGIGSLDTSPGDVIFVLAGARTPFILRPTGHIDEYRLVGDCYILEHMHGEIFTDSRYEHLWGTERRIAIV